MKHKRPQPKFPLRWLVAALTLSGLVWAARAAEPIIYTVRFPAPDKRIAEVEAAFPTGRRETIELMMPVWSPGFYRVEDYAGRVQGLSARAPDGKTLVVTQPQKNRWRIETKGAANVIVSYRLLCNGRSVTTNWVGEDLLALNGAAAFITLAERARRPHEVRLKLPPQWKRAMSGLDPAPDGRPNHFRAADYDTLVDSPIVAGDLSVREFEVEGSKHQLVDAGDFKKWDGERGAQDLEKIVRETRAYWGFLPFKRYVALGQHLVVAKLARPAQTNARTGFARRVELRDVGRRPRHEKSGQLLRQRAGRRLPAGREDSTGDGRQEEPG